MENLFARKYNEKSLMAKIRKYSDKAGQKVVYAVLLLYYVMKSPGVAFKTKLTIAAALGYFIAPVDAVFDLTPLLGFTDDLGVLVLALVKISSSITPEIRKKARQKMGEWFKKRNEKELLALEGKFSAMGKSPF
ncbi:MAG TPA: DUF1232 domain-containing protein [Prolixibacteraceae bacterium]|jgi:uncharacterized membrane protein YkvA (DUF1232 family)|nr:DUF1232 domain-containing protein [Prolixibacteraceae bacterium]NLS99743.1 DUF1232 domain-containing protein [Bacteroidales bacterium]OQB81800.1 MAG: hypothetical protein BWX87_00487 [Bacteroidetes bacterium ADurb.Bin123]HNU78678.1 DUF1232 domain-containing protein [Prolixibacteraceae bacterium]HOC85369.1 DUF1232 domain-containing protein [Prolixibacteraceae bacterium]